MTSLAGALADSPTNAAISPGLRQPAPLMPDDDKAFSDAGAPRGNILHPRPQTFANFSIVARQCRVRAASACDLAHSAVSKPGQSASDVTDRDGRGAGEPAYDADFHTLDAAWGPRMTQGALAIA